MENNIVSRTSLEILENVESLKDRNIEELKMFKKQLRVNLLEAIKNNDEILINFDSNQVYKDTVKDVGNIVSPGYLSLNRAINYLEKKQLIIGYDLGDYQLTEKGNNYIATQNVRRRLK